jgi:hypothetical protein
MRERFHGASPVPAGYYLNVRRWAVEPVARDGDRLPLEEGEWRRIPMVAALLLVPILGVTFLMFMPVAGFVVLGKHLWDLARKPFTRRASGAGADPAAQADADPPAAER